LLRHRQPAVNAAVRTSAPAPALTPVAPEVAPAAAPLEQPVSTSRPNAQPAKVDKKEVAKSDAKAEKPASVVGELAMRELPAATPATDPAAPPPIVTSAAAPEFSVPAAQPALSKQPATSGVVPGRLVHRVNPEYPDLARRAHIGGEVVLSAIIRSDGKVGTVEVISGNPLLARAAVDAVRQWRYEPSRLDGSAVQSEAVIHLKFDPTIGQQRRQR
jgi:protein TonB